MKIKDVLLRDPASHPLVNNGQARIADKTNDTAVEELKGELSTFVCEGQYAEGILRILNSYLAGLNGTSQKGAWVSGFFGSGKSHLLKMLCHLWQDTAFPDGSTARGLVPTLPEEIRTALRELDTAAKRGGGRLAAAGALPSGSIEHVRLTVLGVLFRAVDLPEQYPQAQFCLWLHDQGYLDRVKAAIELAGKSWAGELNNLYVSKLIPPAVLVCDPKFAADDAEARRIIQTQFPRQQGDITTKQFLDAFRRVLKFAGRDGRAPCTLLILDEVQQYIGDSTERSMMVTEVAEAVSKELNGQVMVVGAGQSALNSTSLLQKLMDRFTVRVPLSDTDVETVTRKVLLQKKPKAVSDVRAVLDAHAGEVSRELSGTRISECPEDRDIIVEDYPLLPVRRRFWEHCFRVVDAEGTQSQLRSQLGIIHDAVAKQSNRALGAVIPADELYDQLAPEMVNKAVLSRELNERLLRLKSGTPEGNLAYRICGLVFLIGRLPRESGADIGIRATREHLSDLLVDDLKADNGKLRSQVEAVLTKLAGDGVLMRVGDEFRLQTKEGTEWDNDFRRRLAKLGASEAELQLRREQQLYAEAARVVGTVKVLHGGAKEPRALTVYRGEAAPRDADGIIVWIRDGWSTAKKDVESAARQAGSESGTIFVFIPRNHPQDLRDAIVEADAAEQTLQSRGAPTTAEGNEARQGMQSRRDVAVRKRDELVRQVVAAASVFQGGGSECLQLDLAEKLRGAAGDSLVRMYPHFSLADSTRWEQVIRRARDGADHPFEPLPYAGSTEDHPVCQQVRVTIGAGKSGAEVRKILKAAPYGWPQDAIDAALIALHRLQHVSATLNGAPVAPGALDQNRISKAEFHVEQDTVNPSDLIALRALFQRSGVPCASNAEVSAKARVYLDTLAGLAAAAGGSPPLPTTPSLGELDRLRGLSGNQQLVGIKIVANELEAAATEWKRKKAFADHRRPAWEIAERLAKHAASLAAAADALTQLEAIRSERQLLSGTDPVPPVRKALADLLRSATAAARTAHELSYATGVKTLEENEAWQRITPADRTAILGHVGLVPPWADDLSTDQVLCASLDRRSLAGRRDEADAVSSRVQKALELAARLLEPKIQPVRVDAATLRTESEVREWVTRQEQRLLEAVKHGPVLVS